MNTPPHPPSTDHTFIGFTPVYGPHTPPETPTSPSKPPVDYTWVLYLSVAVLAVGVTLGWMYADATLGGVNIREVQRQQQEALQELNRLEQQIQRAKRELGCSTN